MPTWKYFIRLHKDDNVVTVTKETPARTIVEIDSEPIAVLQNIPFGHKFATKDIGEGDDIIKYGVKIGISNTHIRKGEHVHIHNVEVSLQIRDEARRRSVGDP